MARVAISEFKAKSIFVQFILHYRGIQIRNGDDLTKKISSEFPHAKEEILVNTISVQGFPLFIGNKENAIPTFSAMKKIT